MIMAFIVFGGLVAYRIEAERKLYRQIVKVRR